VISAWDLDVGGVGQMLGQEPPVADIDHGITGSVNDQHWNLDAGKLRSGIQLGHELEPGPNHSGVGREPNRAVSVVRQYIANLQPKRITVSLC
jgi:hypothetical protein